MPKKITGIIMIIVTLLSFCGCNNKESEKKYLIYYTNSSGDKLIERTYTIKDDSDVVSQAEQLLDVMASKSKKSSDVVIKPDYVTVLSVNYDNRTLSINHSSSYKEMNSSQELLYRASVVKCLCQIEGVSYVHFYVDGKEAVYSDGTIIGTMKLSDFVDADSSVTDVNWKIVNIYYSNKSGDALIKNREYVAYSKNMPIEKVVIQKILDGPNESGLYRTLPSGTKLMSVSVIDRVCYVNLSEEFVTGLVNVKTTVELYSVVNTLCTLDGIDGVKILINGDASRNLRESESLDRVFNFNSDIVTKN
ncbi:MAG: GerMN domain-containing protein [Eubacteriales bacterium]|nr:GerMN domain-containing protein [Eubacteriales bacterium]